MKERKVLIGIIIGFLCLCLLTNPSLDSHRKAYKKFYNRNYTELDYLRSAAAYGLGLSKKSSENLRMLKTNRRNYLLFSITTFDNKNVGYGFLGNVHISRDTPVK